MIIKVYAVKDVAAGEFMSPFYVQNDLMLKRVVKQAVNAEKQNVFNEFPEDKQVYCLGEFDSSTGKITSCEPDLKLNCIDLKDVKA